ncbi:Protein translocase subunit SecD [Rickettsiales bacterium Ac37b]|nr:Protein translocase subunit SecD [Rickettsiales bacterium Ac37b]
MLHFARWKMIIVVLVCICAFVIALPSFLPHDKIPSWLPHKTVNLGLDLRGGSQLLLKVDIQAYIYEQLEILQDTLRTKLRAKNIGYQNLSIKHNKILFKLRNQDDSKEIKSTIKKVGSDLDIKITDGICEVTYTEEYLKNMENKVVEQSIEIIRRRVDETGTTEPSIQRQGLDNILLQVPGLDSPEHLKQVLGKTAKLTFHLVDENTTIEAASKGQVPLDSMLLPFDQKDTDIPYYVLKKKISLSGNMLNDARATITDKSQPAVQFTLNNLGERQFGELTKQNVGRLLAIVLDNKIISVASIREPILGGSSIISGNFTISAANDLALLLRAGALPAPLEIIEERTVGPNLGNDSIEAGKKAAIVGIVLIIIFMVMVYNVLGIFASVALVINIILIMAALSLLQATLTMPGIAGIILTMGMAVDANVLIFERIREEFKNSKIVPAAIDRGFKHAFNTILDSNLTTIIVGILLYIFGSGLVKGFGVTLTIGILASMFSAITLTKMMVIIWFNVRKPKEIML